MLSLKWDHPFLYDCPILLSTRKLKLGHNFSHYTSKFFPIHEKERWKIGIFEKPSLNFHVFPNSQKSFTIEVFVPFPSYFVKWEV